MSARESRPGERAAGDLVGDQIDTESSVRARPVTLIGPKLYHLLVANGYVITGICRRCGAPLTNRESVAAGVGPVCRRRVVQHG